MPITGFKTKKPSVTELALMAVALGGLAAPFDMFGSGVEILEGGDTAWLESLRRNPEKYRIWRRRFSRGLSPSEREWVNEQKRAAQEVKDGGS